MADEIKVDDLIVEEQEKISDPDFTDSEDNKISFVGKVMEKLMGKNKPEEKGVQENTDEEDDTNVVPDDDSDNDDDSLSDDNAVEGDDKDDKTDDGITLDCIDSRLVSAAKRRGWSDEKILKYYQEDKTVLDDIASLSEFQETKGEKDDEIPLEPIKVDKLEGLKFTDEQIGKLREEYGDVLVDTVILPMTSQNQKYVEIINKIQEVENTRSQYAKRRDEEEFDRVFTQTLDAVSYTHLTLPTKRIV